MCNFASFVVLKDSAQVLHKPGIDSHAELLKQYKLDDNTHTDWFERNVCFVEIVPPDEGRKAPLDKWTFVFDNPTTKPEWWTSEHESNCWSALKERLKTERGEYVVEWSNGDKGYYRNSKLHRTDGPAVIYSTGTKQYYRNGTLHRTNGPAVIYSDGSKYYYRNDKLHRTNGPAVIRSNGYKEYWKDGVQFFPQNT